MVIAERSLSIEDGSEPKACKITMHAPEDTDGIWICRYTIEWPTAPEESFGAGVDTFQALHLTLQKIGITLYASAYHKAGILVFDKPGRGYGFPMPKNGRYLLIGDDKIFDG
ncbi:MULTISPECIES: DUF6968 family protein [Methylobacterium]|uniref:DUF6968 domain-containing protein n=1 Tax=Methylobacterium longum TaxID=767694 RepID=A0ABT8AQ47_9HYPH|nr:MULTISPECIES: hypothetical protein [Methylobacterium]MCJ2102139.1 hypothetical protein [Methylobacterium sp. E-046]MDN3571986.1 hypothetical protein [Methylobacterium longum]GJE10966.1 hypothetical protein FOHLNKBM_2003 [Methylobacterium longum]